MENYLSCNKKKIKIQLVVNFRIEKIDDVACEKLFNLSVYNSIRDKLFENNDMLIIILTKYKVSVHCS